MVSPVSALQRLTERAVPTTLVALTVLGLVARLYHLGQRVFYYDEAWFGYWTLRFLENGAWEYRPILHGPFFVRLNSIVFPVLGVDDGTARLVVALIGGLLPLSAWLFREHLRSGEVVALGVALAFTPTLVYYSRFMRKDLPLAAFMFVTLGLLVRTYDTRQPRYLYGAAVSLGIAFATKESVLLWIITWLGAGALVLDRHLLTASVRTPSGTGSDTGSDADADGNAAALSTLRSVLASARAGARHWWTRGLLAGGLFLAVVVYFYAPRAGPGQPIGLWRALGGEFGTLPAVIEAATIGSFRKAIDYWVTGGIQDHPFLPYLGDTFQSTAAGALGVSLLAIVGFLWDRYTGGEPRELVAFNFYCGVAATVGYPIANNLAVPWSTIHAIVPLTIPAAVGGYVVYQWGRSRLPTREPAILGRIPVPMRTLRAGLAAVVLLSLVTSAGATVVETNYLHPHESPRGGDGGSEIIYYAQAPAELREVTDAIDRAAATGGNDTDVLYVGASLAMNESAVDYPPATGAWHARMPLPWYTEAAGADLASVEQVEDIDSSTPPVVITTTSARDAVAERLGESYTGEHYRLDDMGDRSLVVFIRQ